MSLFDNIAYSSRDEDQKGGLFGNINYSLSTTEQTDDTAWSAVTTGLEKTGSALRTAFNVYTGDDQEAQELASQQGQQTPSMTAFNQAMADRTTGDEGWWDTFVDVLGAAVEEPKGAFHSVLHQTPNMLPSMGVMGAMGMAGAKLGTIVAPGMGTVVGGLSGAIVGMFAGSVAIETGFIAQEESAAGKPYDRAGIIEKGAKKGATIATVDTAMMALTGGVSKAVFGPSIKASQKAISAALKAKGVNPLDDAAVKAAFKANPALKKEVLAIGKEAAKPLLPSKKVTASLFAGGTAGEMFSEGAGEYLGEKAAGREPDKLGAVLEGVMGGVTGAVHTGIGVAAGKAVAKSQGLLSSDPMDAARPILEAESVDQAIDKFENETLSKAKDVNAALAGEDPLLAEWEARKAAKEAEKQAMLGRAAFQGGLLTSPDIMPGEGYRMTPDAERVSRAVPFENRPLSQQEAMWAENQEMMRRMESEPDYTLKGADQAERDRVARERAVIERERAARALEEQRSRPTRNIYEEQRQAKRQTLEQRLRAFEERKARERAGDPALIEGKPEEKYLPFAGLQAQIEREGVQVEPGLRSRKKSDPVPTMDEYANRSVEIPETDEESTLEYMQMDADVQQQRKEALKRQEIRFAKDELRKYQGRRLEKGEKAKRTALQERINTLEDELYEILGPQDRVARLRAENDRKMARLERGESTPTRQSSDLSYTLQQMESEARNSETKGVNQENNRGQQETVGFSSSSPKWMRDLNDTMKNNKLPLFSRKEISDLTRRYVNGEKFTSRQYDRFQHLKQAADGYQSNEGDFVAQDEAQDLEKRGFELRGGAKIPVTDLKEGDRFVGTIDGVKDEYTVKDMNENGEVLMQDGITRRVDMFDEITVEGIKRSDNTADQKAAPAQPEEVAAEQVVEKKQPWEMTKEEFQERAPTPKAKQYLEDVRMHENKVFEALFMGKPVPKEVLSDYPGIEARVKENNARLAKIEEGRKQSEALVIEREGAKEAGRQAEEQRRIEQAKPITDRIDELSYKEPWEITDADEKWMGVRLTKKRRTERKAEIQKALSEGKPVPPEVLADYPELRQQVVEAGEVAQPITQNQPNVDRSIKQDAIETTPEPAEPQPTLAELKRELGMVKRYPNLSENPKEEIADLERQIADLENSQEIQSASDTSAVKQPSNKNVEQKQGVEAKSAGRDTGESSRADTKDIFGDPDKDAPGAKLSIASDKPKRNTDSKEFKKWFGKSKVVDERGEPLVVYHGSPDMRFISEDGTFKGVSERYGMPGKRGVHWFAKSHKIANTYADDHRAFDYQKAVPGVVPAYLSLKNPLVIDAGGKHWHEAQMRGKTSDVIEEAQDGGYDGVIIKNVRDAYNNNSKTQATDTYAVFDSTQIKSIYNIGTWDGSNPDIRYQADATPGTGITIDQIKTQYPGQAITTHSDGTLSVRFKNGKGVRIKTVDHIGGDDYRFAVETGRMKRDGTILGKYKDGTITLNKNLADLETVIHENGHLLKDIGVLNNTDLAVINNHHKSLVKRGKYRYEVLADQEENQMNTLAQMVADRKTYREKSAMHRVIQKVMDFFDSLVNIGRQSAGKLAREYERGKIYERPLTKGEAGGKKLSVTNTPGKGDTSTVSNPVTPDGGDFLFKYQEDLINDIQSYIEDDEQYDYGLRVIPPEAGYAPQVGDIQPESNQWVDNKDTGEALGGTSAIGIKNGDIEQALTDLGVSEKPGPNGYYFGDTVTLLRGFENGLGQDIGEVILSDAEVIAIYKKGNTGKSQIISKISPTPPIAPKETFTPDGGDFLTKQTIQFIKDMGFEDSINPEKQTVTLYHGTSPKAAKLIEKSGVLKSFPFFAFDKNTSKKFGGLAISSGSPKVFEMEVEISAVLPTGDYLTANAENLYRGKDGVWRKTESPNPPSAPEQGAQYSLASDRVEGTPAHRQPISQQDYIENRKQEKDIKRKALSSFVRFKREAVKIADQFLGPISTRLMNISPRLAANVRDIDYDIGTKNAEAVKIALPLLKKAKKMTRDDYADWDYARKNSDKEKIDELNQKYDMVEEYRAVREMLDGIREEAIEVGYDVGEIKEYWPRVLKDQEGFLRAIGRGPTRPEFTDAIKKKAKDMGIEVSDMDDSLKAEIISNVVLGRYYGIPGPGGVKQRVFEKIPVEFNQFYMDSDAALMQHLHSMRKRIEARRFFGKTPDRITAAKRRMRTAETRLRKMEGSDQKEKIQDLKDDIAEYRAIIEKYKHQNDFDQDIGAYILGLINTDQISDADQNTVKEILSARFNEYGTTGIVNAYKNASYVDTMGSVISALTQIGDLAWAAYEGGMIPALKHAYRSARGKSKITKEDIGVERIAQEFADADTLSKAVSSVFRIVGLEKMDTIGKEALLNVAYEKYKKEAETAPNKLRAKLRPIFGKESAGIVNDLRNNDITENVKRLVFYRLLDFQPAALSETPQKYLTAGNGRIFYMLKTFTLKQFDVFRKEVYTKMRHGDRAEKIQAMKNFISLTSLFVLANAGADELKDWVLGRDTDLEDRVVDNILRLFGVSKFVTWKARTEGVGSAMGRQILPPFKFIDAAYKDIASAGDGKGLQTTASIPIIGKLAYWHMGRGQYNQGDRWDRKFLKQKRRLNKIKDRFERTDNRAEFLREHRSDLRELKRVNKIQGRLNKYRRAINRLKSKPQSEVIDQRIQRLEALRTNAIKKYFGREGN